MDLQSLYNESGERKYLNHEERLAFFHAAMQREDERHRLFCMVLLHCGCRISEGLELHRQQIDRGERVIAIRTLKRKNKVLYRPVPAPLSLIDLLLKLPDQEDGTLFGFKRTWGWTIIKECMEVAGITGVKACPHGLRHAYGIGCQIIELNLPKTQQLLGHKRLESTAIYTTFTNSDVRNLFKDMWFMED